MTHY